MAPLTLHRPHAHPVLYLDTHPHVRVALVALLLLAAALLLLMGGFIMEGSGPAPKVEFRR